MRISDWSSDVCSSDLRVGRQQGTETLRPLDEGDAAGQGLREAGLLDFGSAVEAVEIEVPDRRRAALVDLHEREGRARHLPGGGARRAGQRTNKGAGERSLPGTEVAEKRDHVATPQPRRPTPH